MQRVSPAAVLTATDGTNSVSLYTDERAKPREIAEAMARLKAAFPRMEAVFFNVLAERLAATGFTAERLRDAVNHVIDTHPYAELRAADIMQHDRRLRLYTYGEVSQMVTSGKAEWSDFELREIGGKPYRVKRSEAQ